ncbi:hypothetical protein HPB49_011667 [Dermacentor silvarum]|uniref:Uncharacterized protein n=1 Tax=Dermacentor silvarum TaxID=543639 RepID=A0ACB8DNX9_DERSI|nr:hypothetical protein HPB49_011667 [Dermacentor silvarum]
MQPSSPALTDLAAALRQMSSRNTWRLFRALINPTQSRTETQKNLQRAIHGFAGNKTQLARKFRDQYLCTTQDTRGTAYSYAGSENAELDQPFQLHDLKAALAKMKRGTAPGRDNITVKLLANLPDSTDHSLRIDTTALNRFFAAMSEMTWDDA